MLNRRLAAEGGSNTTTVKSIKDNVRRDNDTAAHQLNYYTCSVKHSRLPAAISPFMEYGKPLAKVCWGGLPRWLKVLGRTVNLVFLLVLNLKKI
jgi:hypothetical protein